MKVVQNPNKFAESLGHSTAGLMMMVCTFGLVGFPVLISLTGYFTLRRSNSPLKEIYVIATLFLAIASIPLAYIVARACAWSVV